MESESKEKYHVGQHLNAFIECAWKPCHVTSMKASQPPSYGIVPIDKGENFYLSPNSLRHSMRIKPFHEDQAEVQELNVSRFCGAN